jgi:putative ABC transport system permease protein
MQIPLVRGRAFSETDTAQSQPVALINERAARTIFPNADPIGQRIANSRDRIMRTIVGIVDDVRFFGLDRGYTPELFLPFSQVPSPSMTLVVSSALPADAVAGAIREGVRQIDPYQAVGQIRPMIDVIAATTTQQQFTSSLLGTFASAATALAAIGLYGVIAVFVSQRRQEFGIRMALGACRNDVLRLVMSHGVKVIAAGALIGILAALALSRLLTGLLFGISATEPLSYLIGALVLLVSGLLACYLPARRAMSVDPARALRAE